ncbi:rhomboid-related protein 1 isoform X3 [Paroedura picta]|uniref:rhomboid-related protein 1 isoform X3 n=1 Tax=Paroedura picta TaxID=143630 RepID=UPI00405742CF
MERSSLLQLIQEQLDPENTGFIGVETFASLVHSHELPLDPAKLEMLVALAHSNDEGQICYQELVDLQQEVQQLQAGHSQRAEGAAPRWPPGRDRPGLLQALCALRGLRDPALRDGPPVVLLPAPHLPSARVHGRRHADPDHCFPLLRRPPEQMGAANLPPRVHEEPPGVSPGTPRPRLAVFDLHVHARGAGTAGLQHPPAADDRDPPGDGPRRPSHQLPLPGGSLGRFLDRLHHGHESPFGRGLGGRLRSVLRPSGQRRHELGRDALPIQTPPHGLGIGVYEFRGGPGRVAAFLPTVALFGSPAQLYGPPGRGDRGHQHGPHHPAQLRGEPARPVQLVGRPPLLRHLLGLRHLLERLRL